MFLFVFVCVWIWLILFKKRSSSEFLVFYPLVSLNFNYFDELYIRDEEILKKGLTHVLSYSKNEKTTVNILPYLFYPLSKMLPLFLISFHPQSGGHCWPKYLPLWFPIQVFIFLNNINSGPTLDYLPIMKWRNKISVNISRIKCIFLPRKPMQLYRVCLVFLIW